MLKPRNLCLWIVLQILAACAAFEKPSAPPMQPSKVPALDRELATPCKELTAPDALDFDVWMTWVQDEVLRAYGECAIRHRRTIDAWPK